MDAFRGPPAKSLLGRHRVLSPSASIRVSPLFLGTGVFGTKWYGRPYSHWKMLAKLIRAPFTGGGCSKETAFEIMDYYYDNGGNVIDTANYVCIIHPVTTAHRSTTNTNP